MKPDDQVKLLYLYNAHFSGSSSWNFCGQQFQQLVNSWNVNIKVIYDLPYATHSYLAEDLTEGRHARQMIYKRFVTFLSNIATNRRTALVSLLNSVKTTCLSLTGGNIRRILVDTEIQLVPGVTKIT